MSKDNEKKPSGFWKRFWFVVRVAEVRLRFILVIVITGGLIGYWDVVKNYYDKYTRPTTEQSHAIESKHEYFCPMHPFVVRPEFGKCPICGMDLVKRDKGAKEKMPPDVAARVQVSPARIKEAGVKVEPIQLTPMSYTIRSVGTVEPNEKSRATIAARFPGRVEKLMVNYEGARVKPNELVVRIYSPKYLGASREYLLALNSKNRAESETDKIKSQALVNAARQRLILAGFTESQVDEIAKSGKADPYINYYSPLAGTVMKRMVTEGEYVTEGQPLLNVADLSKVWIQVKVLESDISFIRLQQPVEIRSVSTPGILYLGNINFIQPTVDPDTRTVSVRVEIENSGHGLRPGMYVTAQIKAPLGGFEPLEQPDTKFMSAGNSGGIPAEGSTTATIFSNGYVTAVSSPISKNPKWIEGYTCVMHPDILQEKGGLCNLCSCGMQLTKWRREILPAIPEQAVIDTGLHKYAYVQSGEDQFDAHEVILGQRTQNNNYPILAGLQTGDKVVTFGSFLIDAENRLSSADAIYRPTNLVTGQVETVGATIVVDGVFQPKTVNLESENHRIIFDRRDSGACTDSIIFPTLNMTVDLKPFQKTSIDLPTTATGEIPFSCGMDMLHGTVTISPKSPDV